MNKFATIFCLLIAITRINTQVAALQARYFDSYFPDDQYSANGTAACANTGQF